MFLRRYLGGRAAVLVWAALTLCGAAGPGRAGSVTLSPAAEGTEHLLFPETPIQQTFFTPGPFSVLNNSSDFRSLNSSFVFSSALEFDLGSVPQGAAITSASFTFRVAGVLAASFRSLDVTLFTDDDGVLELSDFDQRSAITVSSLGFTMDSPPGSVSLPTTVDLTSRVQSLVNQGTRYIGFQFSAPQSNVLVWGSLSGDDAPILTINSPSIVLPEPASVVLLGLGLVGAMVGGPFRGAWSRVLGPGTGG